MTESTKAGWVAFLAALGMLLGLVVVDIKSLDNWDAATTPEFIGSILGHIGVTITAFVGGRLIPTKRGPDTDLKTRKIDPPSLRTDLKND